MAFTPSKRKLSQKGLLYVILDESLCARYGINITTAARTCARAGADILQYRFTETSDRRALQRCQKLCAIAHTHKRLCIVNNRVDIAYCADADGVHLGEGDMPVQSARKLLGASKIIGKTIHGVGQLKRATGESIDYISIGAVFPSTTKPTVKQLSPKVLRALVRMARTPLFAIGGITPDTLALLRQYAIFNIALSAGVLSTKNIAKAIKEIKQCLRNHS